MNTSNQNFQILIEKYLDGKATLNELKKLVSYYESYQKSNNWVEALGPENQIKNKMLVNILEAIQDDAITQVISIPFYKKNRFKYVAAAVFLLLAGIPLLFSNYTVIDVFNTSPIVNEIILPGTDKAILTLDNGTDIILEKGKSYLANHLKSNGEKIIYKSNRKPNAGITYNYLTIPRGGQYHLELSDGTEVWLNSDSKIKYPVAFISGKTREVELLYGEAYFDVSSIEENNGAKFKVITDKQEIEVLGTEFNIKAYQDENQIYSTLVEGKVLVFNKVKRDKLTPSEQYVLNKITNRREILNVDLFNETSWRKGVFSFNEMSLGEIMKVLSRWYDVDIVFTSPKIKDVKFNGVLRKNQNIEDILESIKMINKISYDIKNNTVTFK